MDKAIKIPLFTATNPNGTARLLRSGPGLPLKPTRGSLINLLQAVKCLELVDTNKIGGKRV